MGSPIYCIFVVDADVMVGWRVAIASAAAWVAKQILINQSVVVVVVVVGVVGAAEVGVGAVV